MSLNYLFHLMPKRSYVCCFCQKPLNENEAVSLLHELQESRLERKDACETCYKQNNTDSLTQDIISIWRPQATVVVKQKKKKITTDARALELLRLHSGQNAPDAKKEAFILALHLIRRRKIRFRKEVEIQGEIKGLFEVPSTGEELILDLWGDLSGINEEFQKRLFARLTEDTL
jgi:hypothetical protein